MAKEIKLPKISEDAETATVTEILVSEGDKVEKSQTLIVVDSDKATVEVPSDEEGTVESIKVKVDDEIKTGDVILTMSVNGEEQKEDENEDEEVAEKEVEVDKEEKNKKEESGEKEKEKDKDKKEEEKEDKKEKESKGGEDEDEKEGQKEKEHEETESKEDEDEESKEKEAEVDKEKEAEDSEKEEEKKEKTEAEEKEKSEGKEREKEKLEGEKEQRRKEAEEVEPSAAPNVWRLARELGVELERIKGTGRQGRIMEQDVKNYAKQIIEGKISGGTTGSTKPEASNLPDFSKWGEVESIPLRSIRKATAKNTTVSWQNIPHVTHFDEADISEIEELIENKNHLAEKQGGKLTITAVLLKIVAEALREFPKMNTSIDMENNEIIRKKYIHVGVAVDTEKGLLVPVVRDAGQKDLIQLSVELTELSEKARNGKLNPDDMKGGSFTISNVGGIGGTNFTPIINQYQAGILGVSEAQMKPVWEDGEFKPKLMLPLALSYDHRLIDGADAARFTTWICEVIENPLNLLIE